MQHVRRVFGRMPDGVEAPNGFRAQQHRRSAWQHASGRVMCPRPQSNGYPQMAVMSVRPSESTYSSARRPNASRARDTHPAWRMSSQVVPGLSSLSAAHRTSQHWQRLEERERSRPTKASSQRQARALNATYKPPHEVFAPKGFEAARAAAFSIAVQAILSRPRTKPDERRNATLAQKRSLR